MSAHRFDALDKQLKVVVVIDEVEVLGIDHHHRRGVIAMEKTRIAFAEKDQVIVADLAFHVDTPFAYPGNQGFGPGLQVDDQIGGDRTRPRDTIINLAIEFVFVVAQGQAGKQRVLLQQIIADDRAREKLRLRQFAQLVKAMKKKEELGLQGVALLVLVETAEKRVGLGLFEQQFGVQMFTQASGQAGLADPDRAFDNDVAR